MKLSKQATRRIQDAIDQLDRGINFIKSPDTIIGRRSGSRSTLTYNDERGLPHISIQKDIGSELCCLYNARHVLQLLLTPVIVEAI